jgi:hypothetical protein
VLNLQSARRNPRVDQSDHRSEALSVWLNGVDVCGSGSGVSLPKPLSGRNRAFQLKIQEYIDSSAHFRREVARTREQTGTGKDLQLIVSACPRSIAIGCADCPSRE